MKTYKLLLPALVLSLGFAACDDDDVYNVPAAGEAATVTAASVDNGAVVNKDAVQAINLTYSMPVSLSQTVTPTLNGEPVAWSYATDADGNTVMTDVVIPVSLNYGTTYTLQVPARAAAGLHTAALAQEYNLTFSTEERPTIQTDYLGLTNPNANQAAQDVYTRLLELNGKKVLTGAMANVNNNNDIADWLYGVTGQYPALTGYDFIHHHNSGENWIDYSDITPATTQWNAGGLVQYMWHWQVPNSKEDYDAKAYGNYGARVPGSNNGEGETNFDIRNAVTEGTWEHQCVLEDLDQIAGYLKQLQDAGVAVLWRPLHEAAGSYQYAGDAQNAAWFWWGRFGGEATKALWNLMRDRLENYHGLNNLIWVWTVQTEPEYADRMAADYVGNDKCDLVCVDVYADNDGSQKELYDALMALTNGKRMAALGETGLIQHPEKCISDGVKWAYFMLWYTYDAHNQNPDPDGFGNTQQHLKDVFTSPFAQNR